MVNRDKAAVEVKVEQLLTVWGVIVILWSIFRANIQPPLWFSEFVAKPVIFLLPVFFYLKIKEKKNFFEGVGFPTNNSFREILLAASLLLLVFGVGVLMLFTSKGTFLLFLNQVNFLKIGEIFLLAIATSFSEEVVGRGFLFNYLYKYSKGFIISLFLSATLFFVLYLPGALTLKISGQALFLNLLLNFLMSFMSGVLFYLRRNILSSIAFHAGILLWFDLLLGRF